MAPLRRYIRNNEFDKAEEYVMDDKVKYCLIHEIKDMYREPLDEDYKLFCLILKIRFGKENDARRAYIKRYKIKDRYDKLVLCRELKSGTTFVIICGNTDQSNHLFKFGNKCKVGAVVAVYDGIREQRYCGLEHISTDLPIIPVKMEKVTHLVSTLLPEVPSSSAIDSFWVETSEISMTQLDLMNCSCSTIWNSQHKDGRRCPSYNMGTALRKVLCVKVTAKNYGLFNVEFISDCLTKVFIKEEVLRRHDPDMSGLRASVQATLDHYKREKVPFVLAGWCAYASLERDAASSPQCQHLSYCYPKTLLESAPRYHVEHTDEEGMFSR